MSYVGFGLSFCGPYADSTRPNAIAKQNGNEHGQWKVPFEMVETDSMERLFGNTRGNLTGGHGDLFQVLCALSAAGLGSFNLLRADLYKTNSAPSAANAISNMLTDKK
jgi:hypothetical protein